MSTNEMMALNDQAKILVESGYFPDIKSVAQAHVKILIGRSLGLNEFQSLAGIYVSTKGQIGLMSTIMGCLIKTSKKYDYNVDEIDNTKCIISFFRVNGDKKDLLGVSKFDEKDAAKSGAINKESYKSTPRNMFFARALSNGARWFCPEAIYGYYVMEELDDRPAKTTIEFNSEGVNHVASPEDIPFDLEKAVE